MIFLLLLSIMRQICFVQKIQKKSESECPTYSWVLKTCQNQSIPSISSPYSLHSIYHISGVAAPLGIFATHQIIHCFFFLFCCFSFLSLFKFLGESEKKKKNVKVAFGKWLAGGHVFKLIKLFLGLSL